MCVCVCVCVWCFFYHVLYSLWVKMQEIKAAGDTMSVLSRKWHCDLSSLNAVSTLFVSLWPRCSVTERWSRYHLVSLTLALRSGPLFIGGFIEDQRVGCVPTLTSVTAGVIPADNGGRLHEVSSWARGVCLWQGCITLQWLLNTVDYRLIQWCLQLLWTITAVKSHERPLSTVVF